MSQMRLSNEKDDVCYHFYTEWARGGCGLHTIKKVRGKTNEKQ